MSCARSSHFAADFVYVASKEHSTFQKLIEPSTLQWSQSWVFQRAAKRPFLSGLPTSNDPFSESKF